MQNCAASITFEYYIRDDLLVLKGDQFRIEIGGGIEPHQPATEIIT